MRNNAKNQFSAGKMLAHEEQKPIHTSRNGHISLELWYSLLASHFKRTDKMLEHFFESIHSFNIIELQIYSEIFLKNSSKILCYYHCVNSYRSSVNGMQTNYMQLSNWNSNGIFLHRCWKSTFKLTSQRTLIIKSSYTFNASTFECSGVQLLFSKKKCSTKCCETAWIFAQASHVMEPKTLHFAWMQNQIIYFNSPKANQTSVIVLRSSSEL